MPTVRLRSPLLKDHAHPDEPYLDRLSGDLPPLVFIMGDHRSGTTLLYQSLIGTGAFHYTSAYHIIAAAELLRNRIEGNESAVKLRLNAEFDKYVGKDRVIDGIEVSTETPDEYGFLLENSGFGNKITRRSLPAFRQMVEKLRFLAGDDRPLLLKNPWDFANFVPVQQWFPHAKFIFVHRDPSAVISSRIRAMQSMLQRPNPYVMRISRRYAGIARHAWLLGLGHRIVMSKWFARRMVIRSIRLTRYFLDHAAQIPASQQVELSYEELCARPNETIARILQAVGVTPQTQIDLASTIKPRKLDLDSKVIALQPMIETRLAGYLEYLRARNAAAQVGFG